MVVVAEICAVPFVVFGRPMPSPPVRYPEPLIERVVTGDVVPPMPILELSPSNESSDDPPSGVNENAWFVAGIVAVADDMKVKAEGWLKLMKFEPRKMEPEPVWRVPLTLRLFSNVEVPVPPTKSRFATDNCSVGVDVPMPRFPAKYEVAEDDVAMKFVAFTVFAIVVEPASLSNDHQFKESICDVESRYPATLFCVPVLTVPRPPPATQVLFIA